MNKVLKGLVAVAATAAMAVAGFAGASTAMAADTGTISITGQEIGHTYNAYQVFAGDYADGVLSNVKWGANVSSTAASKVIAALKADTNFGTGNENIFAKCSDAACVAKALGDANATNDSVKAQAFAKTVGDLVDGTPSASTENPVKTYTITGLATGYYIVKDAGDGNEAQHDTVYSRYLAKVVPGATNNINTKESKPSLDKQIKHNEKTSNEWGVVGDNQIGDTVDFRTISTVPDTTGYDTYDYEINDTMSSGLTSNVKASADNTGANTGVTIKVNDATELDAKYYTVVVDTTNSNKFTIKVNILEAIKDNVIVSGNSLYSYYTGVLNKDALTYDAGKQDNTAYLVYSNNPNDTDGKGETPHKTVYDWTFKMNVKKVAEDQTTELTGAKFVLSKVPNKTNADSDINASTGAWNESADAIKFIKDTVNNTYTVAPADYTGNTTTVIDTDKPTIKGLDDATDYYLYETKAPAQYNRKVEPTKFSINSGNYSTAGDTVSGTTITVDSGTPAESMTAQVVNQKGNTLPSTGGMGTVLLYVAGIAVFVLAGATLVMALRRRNA